MLAWSFSFQQIGRVPAAAAARRKRSANVHMCLKDSEGVFVCEQQLMKTELMSS